MWGDDKPVKKPPGMDRSSFEHGALGKPKGQFDDHDAYHEGRRQAGLPDESWLRNFDREQQAPSWISSDSDESTVHQTSEGGRDGGPLGLVLFLLLCFPVATWFIAASMPVTLASERSDLSFVGRLGAWVVAPFYGIGVLSVLSAAWLYPVSTGLNAVYDVGPGDQVGAGYVVLMFLALIAMPAWAWLSNRAIDVLRSEREPGRAGPILGLVMGLVTVVGVGVTVVGAVGTLE